MASIEPKTSDDSLKSTAKTPPELKPQPSDQSSAAVDHRSHPSWSIRTPQKLPSLPRRSKHNRSPSQFPEKYEIMVRFLDSLIASLKLLRLRKSIPTFSKIRVMIESISERRFTHQHLAQMKFLLPEMGVKRVLLPDDETRCMKYDLHLTLNVDNMMINTKKRKRRSKQYSLKDCFVSRLLQFLSAHPELKEKEKRAVEQAKRKQMISNLPQLFDRIYYLFQNPKFSAITRPALIRELTEGHLDITDQSEVEQQLSILQETIPGWISPKVSLSGKVLYSINKGLDPNTLRLRLNSAT